MCQVICTLSESGRHSLSMGATNLCLLLSYGGDVLVLLSLYVKFVLEAQVSVVIGDHLGALAYFLMAVGLLLCFVSAASAKASFDAGCKEMSTRRTCTILLFTVACQTLTLVLLLAAIILCLVHKSLIRDVFHASFLSAIKLYRVHERVRTEINRIQAGFQCCGSRSMQDWFTTPWIPMAFLNVDHPDVARRIIDGEFLTDDAPYSCCNVHVTQPCIHHQVQNVSVHRLLGPGGTLYTEGCAPRLQHYWSSSVLNPVLGFLLVLTLLLILSMVLCRLLETSLLDAVEKGAPSGEGDAVIFKPICPCPAIHRGSAAGDADRKATHKRGHGDGGDRPQPHGMWGRNYSHNSYLPFFNKNQSGTTTAPPELQGQNGENHPKTDRHGVTSGKGDGQDVFTSKPNGWLGQETATANKGFNPFRSSNRDHKPSTKCGKRASSRTMQGQNESMRGKRDVQHGKDRCRCDGKAGRVGSGRNKNCRGCGEKKPSQKDKQRRSKSVVRFEEEAQRKANRWGKKRRLGP